MTVRLVPLVFGAPDPDLCLDSAITLRRDPVQQLAAWLLHQHVMAKCGPAVEGTAVVDAMRRVGILCGETGPAATPSTVGGRACPCSAASCVT